MRLFISINFDEATKERILQVQGRLRQCGAGNFSRPENLHLTLAFLGEIDPARVADVHAAMDAVGPREMELRFGRVGFFEQGGRNRGQSRGQSHGQRGYDSGQESSSQLWWIGIDENAQLSAMQSELGDELRSRGFELERRAFKPHITLAREMNLQKWDMRALQPDAFVTHVGHMSLMHSHRESGVLTYTEIYRV